MSKDLREIFSGVTVETLTLVFGDLAHAVNKRQDEIDIETDESYEPFESEIPRDLLLKEIGRMSEWLASSRESEQAKLETQ